MGTCSEKICKHRILFPSIQHLAWLPQGRPQGKQKCGLRYVKTAIFSRSWIMSKRINICSIFFSPSGSHTILVYRSYTDTKHRGLFATAELLVNTRDDTPPQNYGPIFHKMIEKLTATRLTKFVTATSVGLLYHYQTEAFNCFRSHWCYLWHKFICWQQGLRDECKGVRCPPIFSLSNLIVAGWL